MGIAKLPIPPVKRERLQRLASQARDRAARDRSEQSRRESWTLHWMENLLAALETLSRGFFLGFGLSFIYETLVLNRDFYNASDDLAARVKRASLRAAALG